jgi:hypothetical protein
MIHTHSGILVCSSQRASISRRVCCFADSVSSLRAKSVSLHMRGLSSRTPTYQLAELENDGVGDTVKNTVAGSLAAYEPGVEQNLKVFRYVWLISFQDLDDLADGHRFTLERLQDAQAAGFAENLKPSSNQFDHLAVDHNELAHTVRPSRYLTI